MAVPTNINKQQILELASRFWRVTEIAGFFQCSVSTLYNHVTGEELQAAREAGKGKLRDKIDKRADSDSRILIHMAQVHLDEMPVARRDLASITNDELALEVSRRVSAAKMIKSGEFRKLLAADTTKLPTTAEAAEVVPSGKPSGDEPTE